MQYYPNNENYCFLVSAETVCVFDRFQYPFYNWDVTLCLVGSVHGILCLSDNVHSICEDPQKLYLWNPSVRKFRCVVSTSFRDLFSDRRKPYCHVVGFRFHQPTRDYRVVRVVYARFVGHTKVKLVPRVEVFSLRMNSWREIQDPRVPEVDDFDLGTTVDNYVYWVDRQKITADIEQACIISFDFNHEVFDQVKLPDNVRYCVGDIAYVELMKFEGSLAVCVNNLFTTLSNGMPSQPFYIWLMKEENGVVSWTLHFKVVLKEHGRPFDITRSGTLLMWSFSRPYTALLSCNLKTKQDLQLGELVVRKCCNVDTSFLESLLLLKGGNEL